MPYVDGESLRDRLAKEGELPIAEAVRILRDVADALAVRPRHGVVHRDIKPENVMLSGRHALVMDFGVAKALSEATGRQSLTTVGVALGTPTYMAPEQAVADPHVDHRADIYAFGVMAYELLAGRPPFTGANAAADSRRPRDRRRPSPSRRHRAVPPALAALVMRCLEKRPADRWQSAEELVPAARGAGDAERRDHPYGHAAARAEAAPATRLSRLRWSLALAALLAVLAFGTWRATQRTGAVSASAPAPVTTKRVGVLPFASRSQDTADAYLGDGIATDLTTTLAGMTGLHVVSRSSALPCGGRPRATPAPRSMRMRWWRAQSARWTTGCG